MNQPFEMRDNEAHIAGAVIIDAGRLAGIGVGLPEGFGEKSQDAADLLERRLSRLEKELGLPKID